MLYHLLYPLHTQFAGAERDPVHHVPDGGREPDARSSIGLFVGPLMIRKLREFQIGQVIRQDGPRRIAPRPARRRWAAC